MLIEQGALRQSGRGWSLEKQLDLPMPDSVHAVIANRVDLLDADGPHGAAGRRPWSACSSGRARSPPRSGRTGRVGRAVAAPARAARLRARAGRRPRWPASRSSGSGTCWSATSATSGCRAPSGSPGTSAPPTGSTRCPAAATPTWPRCSPTTAGPRTRSPARSASTPRRVRRPAARDALHRAARRAYALHALDAAASHAGARARAAPTTSRTPVDRLQLELLRTEISFYRDRDRLPHRRRRRPARRAGRPALRARRPRPAPPAPGRCSARPPGCAPTGRPRCPAWTAPSSCSTSCPTPPEKADAYAELGRLHMLNYERDPAIAAAGAAAEIAERLGLSRRRPTPGSPSRSPATRPATGPGWTSCTRSPSSAARTALLALPRAVQNLAYALREEGDWIRSDELLAEAPATVQGGHTLTTGYSGEAMRAYFAGDFGQLLGRRRRVRRHPRRPVGHAGPRPARLPAGAARRAGAGGRTAPTTSPTRWRPPAAAASTGLRWTTLGPRRAVPGAAGPPRRGRRAARRAGRVVVGRAGAGQRRVDRRGRVRGGPDRPGRGGAGARHARPGRRTAPRGPRRRCGPSPRRVAAADGDHAPGRAALHRGGRHLRADPRRHRPDAGAGPGGRQLRRRRRAGGGRGGADRGARVRDPQRGARPAPPGRHTTIRPGHRRSPAERAATGLQRAEELAACGSRWSPSTASTSPR